MLCEGYNTFYVLWNMYFLIIPFLIAVNACLIPFSLFSDQLTQGAVSTPSIEW